VNGGRTDFLIVETSLPAERLDSFLRTKFPAASRGTIQRLIEQGHIQVDGRVVKPTHHPRAGERVDVFWPEPRPAQAQPEEMPLDIIYEDEALLVVNKAPGVVVHPAAGHDEHTLVNALLHHCRGQLSGIGGVARPGIVHRLDKETSGCLVVAKTDTAHQKLADQFASRTVGKTYQAIVCGEMTRESGEIHAAIARHPNHRQRMAVTEGKGREAHTSYTVLEHWRGATRVEAAIHTGRTHQIRVHFQFLGHPLAGDPTYGKGKNPQITETTGYEPPRVLLHAWRLKFTHPLQERIKTFEAPIPSDFQEAIRYLRS
jgi:23S rRNA pseudouridine1911/1915/1917 synthase